MILAWVLIGIGAMINGGLWFAVWKELDRIHEEVGLIRRDQLESTLVGERQPLIADPSSPQEQWTSIQVLGRTVYRKSRSQ